MTPANERGRKDRHYDTNVSSRSEAIISEHTRRLSGLKCVRQNDKGDNACDEDSDPANHGGNPTPRDPWV